MNFKTSFSFFQEKLIVDHFVPQMPEILVLQEQLCIKSFQKEHIAMWQAGNAENLKVGCIIMEIQSMPTGCADLELIENIGMFWVATLKAECIDSLKAAVQIVEDTQSLLWRTQYIYTEFYS